MEARRTLDSAVSHAERTAAEALEKADLDYSRESRTLAARHSMGRDQMEREWNDKLSIAGAEADGALAEQTRRTQNLIDKTNKEFEERQWLADTMAESAERKAVQELSVYQKLVDSARADVSKSADEVGAVLRQGRFGILTEPAPDTEPRSGSTDQLSASLAAAVAQAGKARDQVRARAGSLWTRWFPPLAFTPLAGIVTLVGALISGRTWPDGVMTPVGIAAGCTLASAIAVRTLLRMRVYPSSRHLGEAHATVKSAAMALEQAALRQNDAMKSAAIQRRHAEMSRAREKFNAGKSEIDRRQNEDQPALRKYHEEKIAELQRSRDGQLTRLESTAAHQQKKLSMTRDLAIHEATQNREAGIRAAQAAYDELVSAAVQNWKRSLSEAHHASTAAASAAASLSPSWQSMLSAIPVVTQPPDQAYFGLIRMDLPAIPEFAGIVADPAFADVPTVFELPAGLDLRSRGSLLVHSAGPTRAQGIDVLKSMMLRLVTGFPPGKVRFTIIDPVGLGESFAAFMHLADFEPIVVGDRIWTDPRQIEQRLSDLTDHMEHVIQKYLRNQFSTIQEYNEQAGEVAEPLRFLVIADYPANLTEVSLKRLQGIITSGARCGVFVMIAAEAAKGAYAALLAELERVAVTLWSTPDRELRVKDQVLAALPLVCERPPDGPELTNLLTSLGAVLKDSSRVQVPFEMVAPPADRVWSLSAAEEIRVPLGRAGARKLQHMSLGRGMAQHALVAGRTGSGKSTLFHVLITNLALWYGPDEVEFYLIDFKKGVEFRAYATHALPHARVVAVESEREFGLSVLRRLDAELNRRGQMFRELGVQDIAGFRAQAPGVRMPRVLLAVDEFQEFFVEDDKLSQDASLLLDRLVRQGRAFGMHLVLGSQTLGGAFSIARSTIGQMAVRIALQSSEQDSYLIMNEENTAPRLLTRPGEAIYNDQSGMVEGNSPFQIVWLSDERRESALRQVRARAGASGVTPPAPIVFEGSIPAHVEANAAMAGLLGGETPSSRVPMAWLGEAISIKDPTAIPFVRRSGTNLLIVGQQESAAASMEMIAAVALLAHGRAQRGTPRLLTLDASEAVAGAEEGAPELVRLVRAAGDASRAGGARDLAALLAEAADELARREADPDSERPPMYLFVHGIQRFRDLRRSDDFDFSSDPDRPEKPADRLARILREGPPLGIHVVVWCDSVNNLERSINRQTLREFSWRVVFQMSASDSTHLIDSPIAQNLGRHRAYLYSDDTAGVEKFRPYATPPEQWWMDWLQAPAKAQV
jgi:hypothetical protein